jgi:hypothetical protein
VRGGLVGGRDGEDYAVPLLRPVHEGFHLRHQVELVRPGLVADVEEGDDEAPGEGQTAQRHRRAVEDGDEAGDGRVLHLFVKLIEVRPGDLTNLDLPDLVGVQLHFAGGSLGAMLPVM